MVFLQNQINTRMAKWLKLVKINFHKILTTILSSNYKTILNCFIGLKVVELGLGWIHRVVSINIISASRICVFSYSVSIFELELFNLK